MSNNKFVTTFTALCLAMQLLSGCALGVDTDPMPECTDETLVLARHYNATADLAAADILKQEAVDRAGALGCNVSLFDVLPSAVPGVSTVPVWCCVIEIHLARDCTGIVSAVDRCDSMVR